MLTVYLTTGPDAVISLAPVRWHYLDTMRGMLMLLGVVLHSARPYSSAPWRVSDPQKMGVADALTNGVGLFRMPAFFVIAGFFGMYLLGSRPTAVFLRERMRRVLVPLLVMLMTVNMVQLWFGARVINGDSGDFFTEILPPAIWNGYLGSHLWFLACLAIYFGATAMAAPILRRMAAKPGNGGRTGEVLFHLALVAAVLAPLAIVAIGQVTEPLLSKHMLGVVTLSAALEYLPFFAVGVVLCAYPRLLDRFAKVTVWVVVLAVLAAIGVYLGAGRELVVWKALYVVSWSLLAWMAVRAVFWLFCRYAVRPSRAFRYLSDASYSVYLFHHIVVVVVATWLLNADISAGAKFAIVLTSASLVSLAAYHLLIRPHRLLRYLFNGALRPPPSARGERSQLEPRRGHAMPVLDVAASTATAVATAAQDGAIERRSGAKPGTGDASRREWLHGARILSRSTGHGRRFSD